ncbi:MAG: hypothetical protein RBS56_00290 [Candidatus Gracilibacteria bacterium]|nr:hypothetical protein [Candidatus Gracilibacteria bacterium]
MMNSLTTIPILFLIDIYYILSVNHQADHKLHIHFSYKNPPLENMSI